MGDLRPRYKGGGRVSARSVEGCGGVTFNSLLYNGCRAPLMRERSGRKEKSDEGV